MSAADRGNMCVVMCWALRGAFQEHVTTTAQVLVELFLECFAQQVKSKRVEAGVGEGQDASNDAAHKVNQ